MSYDMHMTDVWQVKTFYRFQMESVAASESGRAAEPASHGHAGW
jgi:hypothetical protein